MRFILSVVLSLCAADAFNARFPVSSFIRPHTRFMIQSVVENRVAQGDVEKAYETCPASSTLNIEGGGLVDSHKTSLGKAAMAMHTLLKSLDTTGDRDDKRRFSELKEGWKQTILAEIDAIIEAVKDEHVEVDDEREASERLASKAMPAAEAAKAGYTVHITTHEGVHALPPAARSARTALLSGVDAYGPGVLTQEQWKARGASHGEVAKSLSALLKALETVKDSANKVFDYKDEEDKTNENAGENEEAGTAPKLTILKKDDDETRTVGERVLEIIGRIAASHGAEYKEGEKKARMEEFTAFIEESKRLPHAERLSRLMTTLGILHMRHEGLKKAKGSSTQFVVKMKEMISKQIGAEARDGVDATIGELGPLFESISKKLESADVLAKTVYMNAEAMKVVFEGTAKGDNDISHLDTHMNNLAKHAGTNADDEYTASLNLIVNNLWRLHAHLKAFVLTYSDGASDDNPASKFIPGLKAYMENIGEKTGLEDTANSAKNVAENIRKLNENARDAVNCILYGRVDALKIMKKLHDDNNKPREENELCKPDFHNVAVQAMKDMGFDPASLHDELKKFEKEDMKTANEKLPDAIGAHKQEMEGKKAERNKVVPE